MKSNHEIYDERRSEIQKRNLTKCPQCGVKIFEIFSENGKQIVMLDDNIYKLNCIAGFAICGAVSGYKIHKCNEERRQCLKP